MSKKFLLVSCILFFSLGTYVVMGDIFDWKTVILPTTKPVPVLNTVEDVRTHFSSPVACSGCHTEHYKEWSNSYHAKSLQNAGFQTLYIKFLDYMKTDEAKKLLGREVGPTELRQCLSCHAPQLMFASDELVQQVSDAVVQGKWSEIADFSVTCVACHTVTPEGHWTGNFTLTGTMYGPIKEPAPAAFSGHQSQHSPLHVKSEMCKMCHSAMPFNVYCSLVYEQGKKVPEKDQKECQECHMKVTGERPISVTTQTKRQAHSHLFPGARFQESWPEAIDLSLEVTKPGQGDCDVSDDMSVVVNMKNKVPHNLPDG